MDPQLRGRWTLDVQKSDFGTDPKPKMGQVNWTDHGWVFAIVFADGGLYADGVVTDQGCSLIGVSRYTCSFQVVTPKHVRVTLREGASIRRVGDIELLDANTTKVVHHVTPAEGTPHVETTIWKRADSR